MKTVKEQLKSSPSPAPDEVARTPGKTDRIKSSLFCNPRMMKIIPAFVDGLPGEVRSMTDMLERNDLASLQKIVHQLLGAGGGYGFDAVTEPAARAEESIKAGKALEAISAEVKALIDVIRRIEGYDESKAIAAAQTVAK